MAIASRGLGVSLDTGRRARHQEAVGSRVLVLFAHPALERSTVQRTLLESARSVDGVTIRDLYEFYPELDIDVEAEQSALLEHDVVVFQHPLYWYSAPAIVRQWQDLVLTPGWAYGQGATALDGKVAHHAISAGGGEEAYRPTGINRFSLDEMLRPFEQTAHLCGMRWVAPFAVYGAHKLTEAEVEVRAKDYRQHLEVLVRGELDAR